MKLNKTCCDLANFGSCFIVHSLGICVFLQLFSFSLRMGQFSNSVAAHLRTNEVEVTPPGGGGRIICVRHLPSCKLSKHRSEYQTNTDFRIIQVFLFHFSYVCDVIMVTTFHNSFKSKPK